jgi:hypothetical protein
MRPVDYRKVYQALIEGACLAQVRVEEAELGMTGAAVAYRQKQKRMFDDALDSLRHVHLEDVPEIRAVSQEDLQVLTCSDE